MLDDEQGSALAKFAMLKSFAQGETLFAAGERDFKVFAVKSGEVAIVAIEVDGNGFVKTGLQIAQSWPLRRQPFLLETSLPGTFAAGDVRCGSTRRVASAVGEGAMAVQFVHEYLASN